VPTPPHPAATCAREPASQLDRSQQLATLLVDGADRSGIRLSDEKQRRHVGTLGGANKPRGARREKRAMLPVSRRGACCGSKP